MRLALILTTAAILASCNTAGPDSPPCSQRVFEDDSFVVCEFRQAHQQFRLTWASPTGAPYRSFNALAADVPADNVAFAMNAGMFGASGAPIGLHVEEGRELHAISTTNGYGNFHMKPNGVLWSGADGRVHVLTTDDYIAAKPASVWATQSGPMLVIDGALHPDFSMDGRSRYVRNGVGVASDGAAFFVISDTPVSFGKLARFFRDHLRTPNALYLDGSVSSLWAPSLNRMDAHSKLGPLIVVTSPLRGPR